MNGYGRGEDNQGKVRSTSVVTRETFGMTLLLFSVILFVISVVGAYLFGEIGVAINAVLLGIFGYFIYPVLVFCVYLSLVMITGKAFIKWRWIARTALVVLSVFLIVQLATSARFLGEGYGAYLSACWGAASETAADATGGGVLFGLVVYPLQALLSRAGAYVLFSLFTAFALFLFLRATPLKARIKKSVSREKKASDEDTLPSPRTMRTVRMAGEEHARQPEPVPPVEPEYETPYGYGASQPEPQPEAEQTGWDLLYSPDPAKNYRNNLIYDKDHWSSRPRRSSVLPNDSPDRRQNYGIPSAYERPYSTQGETKPTYSDEFGTTAERPKAPMPRRVNERRPESGNDGFVVRADEINYLSRPSYKSPQVPPEEEFTSAPHVEDEAPIESEPERVEIKRASPTPTPEPFKSEPEPDTREEETFPLENSRITEETFAPPEGREPRFPARESRLTETPFERESFEELGRGRMGFGDERSDGFGGETRRTDDFTESRLPENFGFDRFETDSRAESAFGERFNEEFDAPAEFEDTSRAVSGLGDRRADFSHADDFDDEEFDPEGETPEAPYLGERKRDILHEIPSEPAPKLKKHVYRPYCRPSLAVLKEYDDTSKISREETERNSQTIIDTLAGFHVDADVTGVTCGPSVTRYDLDVPHNVTVSMVNRREAEIGLRLHAQGGVSVYANNDKGTISIEVPNSVRATVGARAVMQAEEYLAEKPGSLKFIIGKDIEGRNVCGDIEKMTHILVAGATGAGKSVCLNAMLVSLISKYSPEDLRLILIDPKRVEFTVYNGLPHLMINEIINEAQKTIMALNWAIKEMDRRYKLFEEKTRSGRLCRNLDEYNAALEGDEQKEPKIVIVVDELAELMQIAKKDVEERIQMLSQKSRAAGIHLVIATQRPSVNVITGVIKSNLPTRIAFRVIQEVDSRTILDQSGAEKLLGKGDLLYKADGMFDCVRVQGAFLSSEEVQEIVRQVKENNEAYFDEDVTQFINRTEESSVGGPQGGVQEKEIAEEYIRALAIVVKLGTASISHIQRKCAVGYNHAGRIMEWMETMGYVSPFEGKSKARTVLLTKEEFENIYGSID